MKYSERLRSAQRGRENGEKVVRERGALMKTSKAKYYDESLEFL